jgi:hypothetical protein
MKGNIVEDLTEMTQKLSQYITKGRMGSSHEVIEEPIISVKPETTKIKPLRKISSYEGCFLAVDCSTRTLKRANNWGIYLMRVTYALVKGKDVEWGYDEKICTTVGDAYIRYRFLGDVRVELESQMALDALRRRNLREGDFLLLDGPSYFGGARKFRIALYEKCEELGINLLAISKQSPSLLDERGRDLLAVISALSTQPLWVYHPVATANIHEHLYGDVAIVKLCESSPRVFRCDIMGYLTKNSIDALLSPLTSICEDPRCLGYPVALWLAHDFSAVSDAKLMYYVDQIEKTLARAGILEALQTEELTCNFADALHGVRYPFQREMISDYV